MSPRYRILCYLKIVIKTFLVALIITIFDPISNAPKNAAVGSWSADANGSAPASMSSSSTPTSYCVRCGRACETAARCVGRGALLALSAVGGVLVQLLSQFISAFTFLILAAHSAVQPLSLEPLPPAHVARRRPPLSHLCLCLSLRRLHSAALARRLRSRGRRARERR